MDISNKGALISFLTNVDEPLCCDHNGKRQSQIPPSEPTHMILLPVKDGILMRRLEVVNRDLLKQENTWLCQKCLNFVFGKC